MHHRRTASAAALGWTVVEPGRAEREAARGRPVHEPLAEVAGAR